MVNNYRLQSCTKSIYNWQMPIFQIFLFCFCYKAH